MFRKIADGKKRFPITSALAVSGVVAALAAYAWFPIPADPAGMADRVLVSKSRHTITLLRDNHEIRVYRVAIGRTSEGAKAREGDHRTPEGDYILDSKNTQSAFHLAMHISYPNPEDRGRASKLGVAPGGNIMVHGIRNGFGWLGRFHRLVDWTDGCIALTDPEMDQFARVVPVGTPIEIRP